MDKVTLSKKKKIEICYRGMLVYIHVQRENNALFLKTTVFSEKGFIPHSVQSCINKINEKARHKKMPTYLEINEDLSVAIVQKVAGNISVPLIKIIKLFVFIARSWAPLLKRVADQDLLSI